MSVNVVEFMATEFSNWEKESVVFFVPFPLIHSVWSMTGIELYLVSVIYSL